MFDGIIGNSEIKQELQQAVKLNKLSYSYLFVGTEGIGKKLIAKEFAKMCLCLDEHEKYCNNCKSCIEYDSNNHPDFQIIEPEGLSIKIAQIRQMQKKVLEAPIISNKKIYIIDNADLMTIEAQNCLLKTLEEPPKFVYFILIGSMESNFLSTIKSRCTIIKFKDISNEEFRKYINDDISEEMLDFFQGSIGKAEKYKENKDIYDTIFDVINNLGNQDLIDFLKTAEKIYSFKDNIFELLENINIGFYNKIKEDFRFLNCINIVEDTKKKLNANGNFNMCIDNMLFKIWEEIH